MKSAYLLIAVLCISALRGDCAEECKKAEKSCSTFVKHHGSHSSIERSNTCQRQTNRCLAACKPRNPIVAPKANLRQKA